MVNYPGLTNRISGNTAGATAYVSTGTAILAGGNNITLSQNGNSITISGPNVFTTYAASNHSHGDPALFLTNISGTTASNSNGLTLSLSANAGGGGSVNISAGTTSNNLTAFVFSNQNNVTFGLDGSTVTASVNTSYRASNDAIGLNTAITQNGVSMTANSSGLSLNFPAFLTTQSGQAFSADASSTFQTLVFQDSNGVSFSNNAGSLRVTHGLQYTSNTSNITSNAVATNAARVQGIIGSNTTYTSGSVGLRDLNGISFQSTTGQSFQITHDLQYTSNTSNITSNALNTSASRVINVIAATNNTGGGTASLSSNISFSNANGLTFYTSAGNAIAASYTVPTVTNSSFSVQDSATTINPVQRIAFSTGNNITLSLSTGASSATVGVQHNLAGTSTGFGGNLLSASMTHNSSGLNLSLNHPAWLTTAMQSNAATISNVNVSAGTTSQNISNFGFVDSNGISFGLGTGASSTRITATVATNYLTTARASNDAVGLNTAQTNVTWTVNSSGLSLNAAGYAGTATTFNGANISGSITLNSAGLNLSLSGAGGGTTNQTGPNIAAGTQTGTSGTIVFSNSNNITFGMSNSSIVTASFDPINIGISNIGNTAGTTGTFDGAGLQYVFAGDDGIRLSQSSNGSSVTLSFDRMPISTYIPYYPASTGAQTIGAQGVTSASAWFFPVSLIAPVAFNQIQQLITASWVTSSVAYSHTVTHGFGLFSNNAGTLSSISSSSFSFAITGSSVSATLSYPSAFGTAGGYTYTTVAATTTAQAQSLFGTAGNRIFTLGFSNSMSLSEGLYWLGVHQRQSSSSANGGMAFALAGNVMAAAQNAGPMGQSTANYTGTAATAFKVPWGVATSTGSANYGGSVLPPSVNVTAMGMTATQLPMMTFISV